MRMLKKKFKKSEHSKVSQSDRLGKDKADNFALSINIILQWFKVFTIQCNWFHVIYDKMITEQEIFGTLQKESLSEIESFTGCVHEIRSVKLTLLNKF